MFLKKTTYFFYVSIFFLTSCEVNKKNPEPTKKTDEIVKGDIVLIFNKAPENWKLVKKNGSYIHNGKYEIEYTKDGITPVYWSPNPLNEKDTLTIQDVEGNLEISHKYKGLDEFNYILKPKDTVIFTYNKLVPFISILNRQTKKYDGNFDIIKRKLVATEDFPNIIKYNTPSAFFAEDFEKFNEESEQELKNKQRIRAKKELTDEKNLLDSLLSDSLMSKEAYHFYELRNHFSQKKMDLLETKNQSVDIRLELKNDELLNFSFYQDYLKSVVNEKFVKRLPLIKFSNALIPDYRTVYDSINNSNSFSKREKEYTSFIYLENIINNFSNSDINTYHKRFSNSYPKSPSLNFIMVNYNLTGNMSQSLDLKDQNNKKFDLLGIIEKNRGNMVYIDFWASWCAPCRKAMPASKQLREDYRGHNITFIFLALNDKTEDWKKASLREGLSSYEHNYIVENSKSSKFVDDLKLFSIPRYLLYNEEGKLIHTNAPGPDGQEIRTLFDQTIR